MCIRDSLVISGRQPSSELLHTLRFICVCVGHLSASVQYLRHLLHDTEALIVFQATFSHVSPSRLTSTTQPLATVPGYHTISTIMADGVARSPSQLCSRDGKICCCGDRRLEYDVPAFFVPCFLLFVFRFSFFSFLIFFLHPGMFIFFVSLRLCGSHLLLSASTYFS